MTSRVRVKLEERSYDVVVGGGSINELTSMIPDDVKRVAVVTQSGIPIDIRASLPRDLATSKHIIGNGEGFKTLATVERLAEEFATAGLTRSDLVIGLGGGMVTDVAGFAAATWHRGVRIIHISTTLVGIIDAAIGGKTGVNIAAGKNLVGAFWQPTGVICDTDHLATLPERELRCGYGEMAKYHFLTGDDLLSLSLDVRVARCVQIKAGIVALDEREVGRRALLNYGHTFGHALETATDFVIAHGEAVAVGMMFEAHLARVMGRIGDERVREHHDVIVGHYGLSIKVPRTVKRERLIDLMRHDKKAVNGLTFVLDGPNGMEPVRDVSEAAVHEALDALSVP